jgi:hypothetical protein
MAKGKIAPRNNLDKQMTNDSNKPHCLKSLHALHKLLALVIMDVDYGEAHAFENLPISPGKKYMPEQ